MRAGPRVNRGPARPPVVGCGIAFRPASRAPVAKAAHRRPIGALTPPSQIAARGRARRRHPGRVAREEGSRLRVEGSTRLSRESRTGSLAPLCPNREECTGCSPVGPSSVDLRPAPKEVVSADDEPGPARRIEEIRGHLRSRAVQRAPCRVPVVDESPRRWLKVAVTRVHSISTWRLSPRRGPSLSEPMRVARPEPTRPWSDQARGCNPARVTVTSRRSAAFDGRLLAAARAWMQ
jgi:hypothetical protein